MFIAVPTQFLRNFDTAMDSLSETLLVDSCSPCIYDGPYISGKVTLALELLVSDADLKSSSELTFLRR